MWSWVSGGGLELPVVDVAAVPHDPDLDDAFVPVPVDDGAVVPGPELVVGMAGDGFEVVVGPFRGFLELVHHPLRVLVLQFAELFFRPVAQDQVCQRSSSFLHFGREVPFQTHLSSRDA